MWHYIVLGMGWIIKSIYNLVQNYGVAIILFTILIKALLIPLNIKSQKAMKKQQKIQPIIAELQKKYANDQTKLQQEMMKVYKENNVSMTGGCLPMIIQMPVLIALYQAIQKPLTYMFNVPYKDIPTEIIDKISSLRDAIAATGQNLGNLADMSVEQLMQTYQIQISNWAGQVGGTMHEWFINFNFLGLDLSRKPSDAFGLLFGLNLSQPAGEAFSAWSSALAGNLSVILLVIIPILAIISSVAQSKISMHLSGQDKMKDTNSQAQSMNNTMMWMMPIMTGFFTLTLPAGIGLYWIASGVLQIIQQLALNYYFDKKGEDLDVKVPESKHQHRKKSKKR